MLQSFTLREQDLGHLYNHQNAQTEVLDRLCWGSSHGMGLQDLLFSYIGGLKTPRLCMHKQSQAERTALHAQSGEDLYFNAPRQSQVLLAASSLTC